MSRKGQICSKQISQLKLLVLKEKIFFDSHSFRCFLAEFLFIIIIYCCLITDSLFSVFFFLLALLFSHTRLRTSRVHQSRQNRLVACLNIIVITCTNAPNSCFLFIYLFLPALEFNQNLHVRLWSVSTVNTRLRLNDHCNLPNKQRSRDSGVKIILQPESASMSLPHRYQGNSSTGMSSCALRTVIYSSIALV